MKELIAMFRRIFGIPIAYGKDIDGDTHKIKCKYRVLGCSDNQLTELNVPKGVTHIWCYNNHLTELIIPEGVRDVWCYCNQITELKSSEGVERVFCHGNKIIHLDLPDSVTYLECDKEVMGLERYVGKVEMRLR